MQLQRIKILFLSMMLCTTISSVAQNSMGVGTTTPNPNAVLELVSPTNNQGLLVPRLSTAQRTNATFTGNLTNTENGLMVFDIDEGRFYFWYNGSWNTIRNLAAGDMSTATYDTDLDGKPDSAQYALVAGSIDGFSIESSVPAGAVFTDNQVAVDIPFTPAGNITSTDVQSALEEIDASILTLGTGDMLQAVYDTNADGTVDAADFAGNSGTVNGLTVETAVPAGAVFTDSQVALDVSVTPTVDLSSTNVQDALVELQGEIVSAGGGDMLRSTYDPDADGIVNAADNATTVNSLTVETAVPAGAVFTDNQNAAAVPVNPVNGITATDVQTALENLQSENDNDGGGDMLQSTYDGNSDGIVDAADFAANAGTVNSLTVETAVPASADFTDDQSAAEVLVTASGNLTSTDVQSALVELQTDIDADAGGDMTQAVYDGNADGTVDAADFATDAGTVNSLTVLTAVPAGADFTDDQTSAEVLVTASGNLTSTDVQAALVELQTDIDADAGGDMLQATYDGNADGTVDAADLATDAVTVNGLTVETAVPAGAVFTDAQDISTSGAAGNISITGGSTLNLNVNDADASTTNELQTISKVGSTVTLSNGGGSFTDEVGPTGTSTTIVLGAADFKKLEDVETGAGATAGTFTISSNQLYPRAQLESIEGFGKMIAPLNVPNGTRIQQIVVVAESTAAITLDVVQFGFGAASVTEGTATNTVASVAIEGPLNDYLADVSVDIDNLNAQYALILNNQNGPQSMAVYQVQITYGYNF